MAGIYISGVRMPSNGEMLVIFPDGKAYVCFHGIRERLVQAGVIPVSGHGDLIDKQYAYQNTMAMAERTRKMILKQIDALPVIIPEDKEWDE